MPQAVTESCVLCSFFFVFFFPLVQPSSPPHLLGICEYLRDESDRRVEDKACKTQPTCVQTVAVLAEPGTLLDLLGAPQGSGYHTEPRRFHSQ